MTPFTSVETIALWAEAGAAKHREGPIKSFSKGLVGGMLLSCSGIVSLITGGGLTVLGSTYPGATKIIFAAIFPIGIIMCILMGVDLLTSNQGIMLAASLRRKVPWWAYASNMATVTLGNFIGSLIIAALFGHATGNLSEDPYKTYVINFANHKSVTPSFGQIVARGVGCNFLVCIAVFQAYSAREVVSKVFATYPPIFLFVCFGFDHVVANMLFVPLGMMLGGANSQGGVWYYLWHSFLSAWIGNALGAALITVPMVYIFPEPASLEDGEVVSSNNSSVEKGFNGHIA